ncbi:MAG: LamG-like jellyroll fold domain-containing protein [Candidatus Daviesbacteria bacterium]|nr:LamG-like jellyroll fold domain-containing protein [Candidatus Daviesbacteria bacterium]
MIILLGGLVLGVVLVQQKQLFKPKASELETESFEVEKLTTQLVQQNDSYKKAQEPGSRSIQSVGEDEKQINSMVSTALRRKEKLLKLADLGPEEFLTLATLAEKKDSYPEAVRSYLEEKKEVKGEVKRIHVDNFQDNKEKIVTILMVKSGNQSTKSESTLADFSDEIYELSFVNEPQELSKASEITVKGVALDQKIVTVGSGGDFSVLGYTPPLPTTGEQKTAVLLVNFQDDQSEPFTIDQANSFFFTEKPSVNEFYKENSYNKTYFSGRAFGWFTIAASRNGCSNMDVGHLWRRLALNKAAESGVNLEGYSRLVFILPKANCGLFSVGWGTVGGNPSEAYIVIDPINFTAMGMRTVVHELGHNLGLNHANNLLCGSKSIDVYTNCFESEYGDPFDAMGSSGAYHLSGPHKDQLGWLDNARIQSISQSGTYKVSPLEVDNNETHVLIVPKTDTDQFYYIEYRQPIGYDSSLRSEGTSGVQVRILGKSDIEPFRPKILDLKYQTYGDLRDAALNDGESFVDPANNISIKQLSHDSNFATVEINLKDGKPQWWKFDEGSGITARSSLNPATATLNRGPVWITKGCVSGKCLSFDGVDDYVRTNYTIPAGADFTISVWVNSTMQTNSRSVFRPIITQGLTDNTGANAGKIQGILIQTPKAGEVDHGKIRVMVGTPSSARALPIRINDGAWHQVTVVKQGTTVFSYLDGVRQTQVQVPAAISTSTPLFIGGTPDNGRNFKGLIDEVKIFNKALSDAEVTAEYNSRGAGS